VFAIAQFGSLETAFVVCLNLIQFIVGSYFEPRIAGGALAISPFLVLFAVFFWTFLSGGSPARSSACQSSSRL
jgi:AI-2 transport protein TqsA